MNPKFNEKFRHAVTDASVVTRVVEGQAPVPSFVLSIFDDDGMHGEDGMGQLRIPLVLTTSSEPATFKWYTVQGGGQGELQVKLEVVLVDD